MTYILVNIGDAAVQAARVVRTKVEKSPLGCEHVVRSCRYWQGVPLQRETRSFDVMPCSVLAEWTDDQPSDATDLNYRSALSHLLRLYVDSRREPSDAKKIQ